MVACKVNDLLGFKFDLYVVVVVVVVVVGGGGGGGASVDFIVCRLLNILYLFLYYRRFPKA